MKVLRQTLRIAVLLCVLSLSLLLPSGLKVKAQGNACNLSVPRRPLTAQGLATPWILQAPCQESNAAANSVFVQADIFDFVKHTIRTYSPLVITEGTTPAVKPVVPVITNHDMVGIFGGGNDDATTLMGPGASSCVNGADGKVFGQVFFCNSAQFFAAVKHYGIGVPQLGTGIDGKICPSTRAWRVVDQDPSDNVQTTYLVLPDGRTAQNTFNNRNTLHNATVLFNPSDNLVLTNYVDPALHCAPWKVPDVADNGTLQPTQGTDELQAAAYQENIPALVPAGDPMVGPNNLDMLNAYRAGVDQPTVPGLMQASTLAYCKNLKNTQPVFLANHKALLSTQPSPVAGENLYTFLEARLAASFQLLGCP